MRRTTGSSTDVVRSDAIAQWGKVCDQNLRRYFDVTRGFSEVALKTQYTLVEAAGRMFAAGSKVVAGNIGQLTNGEKGGGKRGAKRKPS
jgi:hypothetical protein